MMIDGLKPYTAMKDSGVPWLGEVPEHWACPRVKTMLVERTEKDHPNEPLLAATQSHGVVRKDRYENRTVTAQKDFHLLKLVRINDFVISLRSFQGGIEYARDQGIISPAYTILYPRDASVHEYLSHLFKSKRFIEGMRLFVTGIREGQNIEYPRLARSRIALPPVEEQHAIVRFLNHTDSRIRRYIRAKQKLIKLLEEQKQAIIHRAVTRGLDPNVRLKPSGVEWLGEVPEHWEVKRLKLISRIAGRIGFRGYTTGDLVEAGNGALALGATHIHSTGELDFTSPVYISWEKYFESPEIMVRKGDILVVQRGSTSGKIGYVRNDIGKATINPSLILVSDVRGCAEFVFLALTCSTVRSYFNTLLSSTAILMLSQYQVGNAPLLAPPIEEQYGIVEEVKLRTHTLQTAIEQATRKIYLLHEYRTRLIADIVTGKLDVREAAVKLPEEAPEAEPLDEIEDVPQDELVAEDIDVEAADAA